MILSFYLESGFTDWIPAFAGMTEKKKQNDFQTLSGKGSKTDDRSGIQSIFESERCGSD